MSYWNLFEQKAGGLAALCYLHELHPDELNFEKGLDLKVQQAFSGLTGLQKSCAYELSFERLYRSSQPQFEDERRSQELIPCSHAEVQKLVSLETVLREIVTQLPTAAVRVLFSGKKRLKRKPPQDQMIVRIAGLEFSLTLEGPSQDWLMAWQFISPALCEGYTEKGLQILENFQVSSPIFEYAFTIRAANNELAQHLIWVGCLEEGLSLLAGHSSASSLLGEEQVTLEFSGCVDFMQSPEPRRFSEIEVVLEYRSQKNYGLLRSVAGKFEIEVQEKEFMSDNQKEKNISFELNLGSLQMRMVDFLKLRVGSIVELQMPKKLTGYIPLGDRERALVDIEITEGKLELLVADL